MLQQRLACDVAGIMDVDAGSQQLVGFFSLFPLSLQLMVLLSNSCANF